jgi:hypothetical protein
MTIAKHSLIFKPFGIGLGLLYAFASMGCVQTVMLASAIQEKKAQNKYVNLRAASDWRHSNAPEDSAKISALRLKFIIERTSNYKKGKLKHSEITAYEEFDSTGHRTQLLLKQQIIPNMVRLSYEEIYDRQGKLIERRTFKDNGGMLQDVNGRLGKGALDYIKNEMKSHFHTKAIYSYGGVGRLLQAQAFDAGNALEWSEAHEYDAAGRKIKSEFHSSWLDYTAKYEHDTEGRVVKMEVIGPKNEALSRTEFKYDAASGNLVEQTKHDLKSFETAISKFKYEPQRNKPMEVFSETKESQVTVLTKYNDLGYVTESLAKAVNLKNFAKSEYKIARSYNAQGLKVEEKSYRDGELDQTKTYEYGFFDDSTSAKN